ncbi:MAG: hypothetical protein COU47_02995 [Candidatus Niyogibacteria bacterium CG10_big_fil_rev_8_21_14_0_10_46_36]|uniref:Uncharacterized protein n=1 Tax=Candidatus Niyogibacteria bacterium CG10_big_fil_rev_8_21_14_0_10_46_36 TaxID=1974726 RepID=A0A2H0TEY1_9BACT|nr:MAG: hypothetical protein COU47_02995 [Candidatus Niyogibacteria bacterium CG10_big_fil_rev_8_21_14_0_10_46_36]
MNIMNLVICLAFFALYAFLNIGVYLILIVIVHPFLAVLAVAVANAFIGYRVGSVRYMPDIYSP